MKIESIKGNVAAPKGFWAGGIHSGIRKNKTKNDLALIVSETKANVACTFTLNKVKASPLRQTMKNVADGQAQAIIVNSGNANSCNPDGDEKAAAMCRLAAQTVGIDAADVVVSSTGVIGKSLPLEPIEKALPALYASLSDEDGTPAAYAIMTTDTRIKEITVAFEIDGIACKMGAIAKGSGMIHPNMGTMLAFITTDVAISSAMLKNALGDVVEDTFNMISIDGDTSTNDIACVMANGQAGNKEIVEKDSAYADFEKVLRHVSTYLSREIARDGEGAGKLIECRVTGAEKEKDAKKIAKSVIASSLFKTAMAGADANWGRVLCAVGYSGAAFNENAVDIALSSKVGILHTCKDSMGLDFDEELAKKILSEDEIVVEIVLHDGEHCATAWGCDLTGEYVNINASYRT